MVDPVNLILIEINFFVKYVLAQLFAKYFKEDYSVLKSEFCITKSNKFAAIQKISLF